MAPTTVLAQQHYQTLRERMSEYPVTIELLSRFRTAAEQKRVLVGLADGSVDVVVGTHRLVSRRMFASRISACSSLMKSNALA